MGMTITEKILARHAGVAQVAPGDIVTCDVDLAVLLDIQFSAASGWQTPTRIADAAKVAVVMDHAVPAPSVRDADAGVVARKFVADFGITKFFDIGSHGIVHQVVAERGLARPGEILACTDSHTCAAGALNCLARGLGPVEVLQIMCKGTTWFQVVPTIHYDLIGVLPPFVSGKDVFLHIAGAYGDAANRSVEFGGDGLASLPMSDRRTIATQCAEISADFALFPADEVCQDYVRARTDAPFEAANPDPDARYEQVRTVDLSSLQPVVALPGHVVNNVVPVAEVADVRLDQCFIGSCANGQLDDLRVAAEVVDGHHVVPGTRLLVTPASQAVYLEAVRLGYVETLVEAGAVVTNATCGACFGYHMGVLGQDETCLTASTRNFKGRMGDPSARIFMASPATVATSALTGRITDPRDVAAVAR